MKTIQQKLEEVEKALKRWHPKLKRASNEVDKLEKKRRKLAKEIAMRGFVAEVKAYKPEITTPLPEMPPPTDLDIPKILSRNPDVGTAIAARKTVPAIDQKKMPLSGRDAAAYLKEQSAKVTARRAKKELRQFSK